jgi:hypothetical protein
MTHCDIDYNWRATMGNASSVPSDVADYLDLVASLVKDDGFYPHRTANLHTCAIDDPIVMLHHVRREGLCSTVADHRLYDRAVASVRQHRQAFFCDAEIDRRMKLAGGSCPMCGFVAVFHGGDDSSGYRGQMMHCQHNLGHRVKAADIEAYLRRPSSWQGSTWPYAWMAGNKLTLASGKPFSSDGCGRTPCLGCQEMEAYERMEQALSKLVGESGLERFAKPGWSSPVSEYVCKWDSSAACGAQDTTACDHVYMQIKRVMHKAQDGWGGSTELRLNGAGLKLYIQPVRRTNMSGSQITFGMRVGGDQVNDYPGFQAHAHQLFTELGVPAGQSAKAA